MEKDALKIGIPEKTAPADILDLYEVRVRAAERDFGDRGEKHVKWATSEIVGVSLRELRQALQTDTLTEEMANRVDYHLLKDRKGRVAQIVRAHAKKNGLFDE